MVRMTKSDLNLFAMFEPFDVKIFETNQSPYFHNSLLNCFAMSLNEAKRTTYSERAHIFTHILKFASPLQKKNLGQLRLM